MLQAVLPREQTTMAAADEAETQHQSCLQQSTLHWLETSNVVSALLCRTFAQQNRTNLFDNSVKVVSLLHGSVLGRFVILLGQEVEGRTQETQIRCSLSMKYQNTPRTVGTFNKYQTT